MKGRSRFGALAGFTAACLVLGLVAASTTLGGTTDKKAAAPGCLNSRDGRLKHVIYIQFDNVHAHRDNPNVPSDLEQMPHLKDFLEHNGTLSLKDHTILISHTGGGILSTLTGLYPDRHGQAVSNSYGFFRPDKSVGFSSTFKYWTDQTDAVNDPLYNMVNGDPPSLGGTGAPRNTPAPWVPFTRAGCDVGNVSVANTVLENTNTDATGDMTRVFGVGSPEWNEALASSQAPAGTPARNLAQTDFVGIAIHCAAGGGICNSNAANARPDPLPDESGGYTGFKALFGAKYVDPAITKSAAHPSGTPYVTDTNGDPITDQFGQPGFPGFDGVFAKRTLGYVAQMQENGVPVTFAYISDAHDAHGLAGEIHRAYGPGEAGYVQQLRDYDKAFADFFDRLQRDGITRDNTLFVVTTEEEDHFAGTMPDAPCDGVNTPCTYDKGHVTEVNGDLKRLVATYNASRGTSATTSFSVHSDMAPNVYVTGKPDRTSMTARQLEQAMADMTVTNPLTGKAQRLFIAMADPVEEKTLHMVTADPARTPTFTPFAQGDYFLNASSTTPCTNNDLSQCVFLPNTVGSNFTFAWNHGGIQPEVVNTWIGWVGPGIAHKGGRNEPWSERDDHKDIPWTDHVDVRPTILALAGLQDDYVSDGRVVTELLKGDVLPKELNGGKVEELGRAWKAINASVGPFNMDTLTASTGALASHTVGDGVYQQTENQIESLTADRDALAGQIRAALDGATNHGQKIDEKQAKNWIAEANWLLGRAHALAQKFRKPTANPRELDKIKHFVVIYEENHSFDNLYGGWEGVNGLANADAAHTLQTNEAGNVFACLKQNDNNLATPPLTGTCSDATPGTPGGPFTSHFKNAPFTIDDYIAPTDTTCPPNPLLGFASPGGNGWPKGTGAPGGCTRDIVHRFYHEQYQLDGGKQDHYTTGSDAMGLTQGVYDTKALPIYAYLHDKHHPDYAIEDNFFQGAFGGSFLNHQWLIAAASPVDPTGAPGGANAARHPMLDANGMPSSEPLYTPTMPLTADRELTANCSQIAALPAPINQYACGNWGVNTMQSVFYPSGTFGALLPAQSAPTIGDELSDAGVDWAWYAGGWSNADGDVGAPGYTNGSAPSPTTTGCSDPYVDPNNRGGVPAAQWPRCPSNLFQYHHQPFNYFKAFDPATPTGAANRAAHLKDEAEFQQLADSSAKDCNLKAVSFIKPFGTENEHPGYASEPNGSDHLVDLLQSIQDSKCAKDTMVIVTYDEFGGQWDHVPPPGQGNDNGPHDIWGPGTRIPTLVVAPHLKGDFVVDSTGHDTTSILSTLEHRYGLDALGTRDAAVNDLSTVFDAKRVK